MNNSKVVISDKMVAIINVTVTKENTNPSKLSECVNYTGYATFSKGKWYAKHIMDKLAVDQSKMTYSNFLDGYVLKETPDGNGGVDRQMTAERHDVLINPFCGDYII
jgi:hypothetical protein